MPTLPRLENAATWFDESVSPNHGVLVWQEAAQVQVWLVMKRACSSAPTVITFLALAGDWILSGVPPVPSSAPWPALPAAKTHSNGCEPDTVGSASRTAAS